MKIEKYKIDFPDVGYFNWKTIRISNTYKYHEYFRDAKVTGVVLHDDNFMSNGVIFKKREFVIVDENPLYLSEKQLKKIKRRLKTIQSKQNVKKS